MGKKMQIITVLFIITLFLIRSTFALFRNSLASVSSTTLASWNVTLEQGGVNNDVSIIPGIQTDSYALNIKSLSEVDITYDIIISNLPSGVSIDIDGVAAPPAINNVVTITNAGTILYNASEKMNTHILTFSAASNATVVNNQTVTVNVIAKQIVGS